MATTHQYSGEDRVEPCVPRIRGSLGSNDSYTVDIGLLLSGVNRMGLTLSCAPFFFYGIHNHRTMDGGKNPQAKTEPKERNFGFLTFGSAGFSRKSVLTEKKWKNFVCLLRAPFPLRNFGGGSWGFVQGVCAFC